MSYIAEVGNVKYKVDSENFTYNGVAVWAIYKEITSGVGEKLCLHQGKVTGSNAKKALAKFFEEVKNED
jgi:hypothetical protein